MTLFLRDMLQGLLKGPGGKFSPGMAFAKTSRWSFDKSQYLADEVCHVDLNVPVSGGDTLPSPKKDVV